MPIKVKFILILLTIIVKPDIWAQDSINIYMLNTDASHKTYSVDVFENINYPYPYSRTRTIQLPYNQPQKVSLLNNNIHVAIYNMLTVWDGDTLLISLEKDNEGKSRPLVKYDSLLHFADLMKKNKLYYFPYEWVENNNPTMNDFKTYYGQHFYIKRQRFITETFGTHKKPLQKLLVLDNDYRRLYDYLNIKIKDSSAAATLNEDSILLALNKPPEGLTKTSSTDYRLAVYAFATYLTNKYYPQALNQDDRNQNFIKTVRKYFSGPVAEFLLMQKMFYILHNASNVTITSAQMALNELQHSSLNSAYKAKAREMYAEYKKTLKQLNDISNAKVKTPDGKIITLSKVLKPGTPVYIDFWATWCIPCINEFPHLKKAATKHPNIQFISLSIDEDEASWRKFVKEKKLDPKKTFLLVDHKNNPLYDVYSISEVPRFILFNKSGECVSANFIRPSSTNFDEEIKNSLKMVKR